MTPAGKTEFVIAEPHTRRRFIREWLVTGPFDNTGSAGVQRADVTPATLSARSYDSAWGPAFWRRVLPQFVRIDLNAFYGRSAEAAGKPVEWLCAYAFTQVDSPSEQHAWLELGAAQQPMQAWLNGNALTEKPVIVTPSPQRFPIRLHAGANQLMVKNCKTTGDWFFTARITDKDGHDMPGS